MSWEFDRSTTYVAADPASEEFGVERMLGRWGESGVMLNEG